MRGNGALDTTRGGCARDDRPHPRLRARGWPSPPPALVWTQLVPEEKKGAGPGRQGRKRQGKQGEHGRRPTPAAQPRGGPIPQALSVRFPARAGSGVCWGGGRNGGWGRRVRCRRRRGRCGDPGRLLLLPIFGPPVRWGHCIGLGTVRILVCSHGHIPWSRRGWGGRRH